ncbi:hypothetical protein DAPPUDRAFT_105734 [Daphnia pulex]|uniref:Uncharacterized protein n=1 Tax=Daphnia pulex TaxID=6669 RepID=E9GRM4_DAPPU|nr:hypothetical protein DAPPUDRAFT_105734 [Daphnia pulex]|eukprot:EFX77887.1 hypothetical protein DAPPUDRAFT_105734 [Daphnia pulex]
MALNAEGSDLMEDDIEVVAFNDSTDCHYHRPNSHRMVGDNRVPSLARKFVSLKRVSTPWKKSQKWPSKWSTKKPKLCEEDRIKDFMNQLKQLQSAETLTSQEKLVQLEDIETAVQERLEGVTQLLHSGHDLVKETPFYQMPESAYALLDTIKIIEEAG